MNPKPRFSLICALALSVLPAARGQSAIAVDVLVPFVRPPGVTRLLLATDIPNGFVPPEFAGRVRVPPLERVWLLAPQNWPYPVQWTKNGAPIAGATMSPLVLRQVTSSDNGLYALSAAGTLAAGAVAVVSTRVQLDVVRDGHFGNFSARVTLSPGADTQIVGYVVDGRSPKRLLIRAVGPSLQQFGVANRSALPRFRLFKSDGTEFLVPRVITIVFPPAYWSALFKQAGAFPLTKENAERPHIAYETYDLPAGTYTVHVNDDSARGGQVLVEVYEFDTYPPLFGLDLRRQAPFEKPFGDADGQKKRALVAGLR